VSDQHAYAQRTRFVPGGLLKFFSVCTTGGSVEDAEPAELTGECLSPTVRRRTKGLWEN
jgi:hypothetical protein